MTPYLAARSAAERVEELEERVAVPPKDDGVG
jgi:hypothetical protein